eukprot:1449354-Amphidinium_carterae.2
MIWKEHATDDVVPPQPEDTPEPAVAAFAQYIAKAKATLEGCSEVARVCRLRNSLRTTFDCPC